MLFLFLGWIVLGTPLVQACTYSGKDYTIGQQWKAIDGCNACVCGIVGSICTKRICNPAVTDAPDMAICVITGTDGTCMAYKDGETFPSLDGCNTCTCRNGMPLCTLMACIQKECTDAATGKTYSIRQTFPSADGCNTCQCFDGGISCTKMACGTSKPDVCKDSAGIIHQNGESFKSTDGCNTCLCQDGQASCTEMACMKPVQCFDRYAVKLHNDGDKFDALDGCNTCSCNSGVITCTKAVCVGTGVV